MLWLHTVNSHSFGHVHMETAMQTFSCTHSGEEEGLKEQKTKKGWTKGLDKVIRASGEARLE